MNPRTNRERRGRPRRPALLCGALLLTLGCGDDTGTQPSTSTQEQVEAGLAELAGFGGELGSDPGAQLADSEQLNLLFDALPLPQIGGSTPVGRLELPDPLRFLQRTLRKLGPGRAPRTAALPYGTYERDVSVTEPLPGWVLVAAGEPSDGYVFHFGLEDDIGFQDAMGMLVPVQGEFRFLDVQIDDPSTPDDPSDDILTHVILEVAATPNPPPAEPPTLLRLNLQVTLDPQRLVESLLIGDRNARSRTHPGAAFVGFTLFAVEFSATPTTADILLQVYQSLMNYVVRLEIALTGNLAAEQFETASFTFGYGRTQDPTEPPWEIAITLDTFRQDPVTLRTDANVSGEIRRRGVVLATLAGDTTEVPVDYNGDSVPDDMCVNVDVSFVGDPDAVNICLVLAALQQVVQASMDMVRPAGAH